MSNVVGIKGAAQDPDNVLEEAKGEFDSVLVIGWDINGELDVRASLNLQASDCLWMVESFKLGLISGQYDEGDQ